MLAKRKAGRGSVSIQADRLWMAAVIARRASDENMPPGIAGQLRPGDPAPASLRIGFGHFRTIKPRQIGKHGVNELWSSHVAR